MTFHSDATIHTPMQWQEGYKAGDERLAPFYPTPCWEWPATTPRDQLTREELAEWKQFLAPFADDVSLLAPIEALVSAETRAVLTGQQAGAGMTPILMVYKAFAAKHWAEKIARRDGVSCVPIFWIASEDHDLAEVEAAAWLANDGERRAHSLAQDGAAPTRPISKQKIDEQGANDFLNELAESTYDTEFRPAIINLLKKSFEDGATFESHFLHLFCQWLLPLGIVPVVPRLSFMRRRSAALIQNEIESDLLTNELIQNQSDEIARLGIDPPLHRSGDEVNFFLHVDGHRGKVIRDGDTFVVQTPDEAKKELLRIDKSGLLEILEDDPERFSPSAALRPLVQDTIFPTAVYIAGPTELAYHAQIGRLYKHFSVARPAVFPRPNVVLLDTKTEKGLEKLGLDESAACAPDEESFLKQGAEAHANDEESRQFQNKVEHLRESLGALEEWIKDFTPDTGVRKAAEKLNKASETGIEKLAERFENHLATRDASAVRARENVQNTLYPSGIPQERAIGILSPLLIQYGPGILERLYGTIDYTAEGFQAVSLKSIIG